MTKKHFIALADAIREFNKPVHCGSLVAMSCDRFSSDQIRHLADFCQSQNPRFDRQRWLDYIAGKVSK